MWVVGTAGLLGLALGSCRYGLDNAQVSDDGFVVPPGCGDGVLDSGEQCDDGNDDNRDGCLENCQFATCGDGVVRRHIEQCDDGNDDEDDDCTSICRRCGQDPDARFVSASNRCYTWNSLANTYAGAVSQCIELGGYLVTYSSADENAEVTAALPVTDGTWIGLLQGDSGDWKWKGDEPQSFTNWAPDFPDVNRFGAQLATGEWISSPDGAHPYLCEIRPNKKWAIRPEDNHAYRFFSTSSSWEVAAAECAGYGAHLAVLTTAEELVFVRNAFPGSNGWIGLSRTDDDFEWIDGSPYDFHEWEAGHPNVNNCTRMSTRWAAADCSLGFGYLCELD